MFDEAFEFEISQYLDGALPAPRREALEKRLAEDPQARRLLEQYRQLDAALAAAAPLPAVHWDRFSQHVQQAIDDEEQAQRLRISSWMRTSTRLAIAAGLLLVVGIWAWFIGSGGGGGAPQSVAVVEIGAPAPTGPAVVQIEVLRPTPAQAAAKGTDAYALEDLVTVPARIVVVASESDWGQDTPY